MKSTQHAEIHSEYGGEMDALMNELINSGPKLAHNPILRKSALSMAEHWVKNNAKKRHQSDPNHTPSGVIDDQEAMTLAILRSVERALTEFNISDATYREASEILGRDLLVEKKPRMEKAAQFREKYGFPQPSFLTISPSKVCNLRCVGCYADADASLPHLEWDVVDRIVQEAHDIWGTQFMVISGGEPLAYRSQGKGILDLAEKHQSSYFLMYTNSTLITPEVADRMANLGNVLPCISLEGWEASTDARRGKGVYQKVMDAMDLLHEKGVLFGVSLTATRQNAEEILSDEFIDFLFNEKHALLAWIFQYMPIGRSYTLDLMPTPEQRMWMWKQSWKIMREKRHFLADFWNHGTVVDGCLSGGGHGRGGYYYIEWNGNVTPCVFVPYSPVNINEIYARGGTLNDIYNEPFFDNIRRWQAECHTSNLLAPCLIRDHNPFLRDLIRKYESEPIDDNAASAIQDADYAAGLDHYAADYSALSGKVWQKYYIDGQPINDEDFQKLLDESKSEKVGA